MPSADAAHRPMAPNRGQRRVRRRRGDLHRALSSYEIAQSQTRGIETTAMETLIAAIILIGKILIAAIALIGGALAAWLAWAAVARAIVKHEPIEYYLGWGGYSHPIGLQHKISKEEADALHA